MNGYYIILIMSSSSPSSPLVFPTINLSSFSVLVNYLLFLLFSSAFLLLSAAAAAAASHAPDHQTCVHEHFSALLDLKRGFHLHSAVTHLSSWNINNRDCCSWEGIICNTSTGHVVGLNLSSLGISSLFDFESLFRLQSLQRLDLSANNFYGSPIPSTIHHLASLTHLNLSFCNFYGQIPLGFASLTRLVSLDLSYNNRGCFLFYSYQCNHSLSLKSLGMTALLQNLSSLRELHLDMVDLSTEAGQAFAHAPPGLQKLTMRSCHLSGPIHPPPSPLPLITHIDLRDNNLFSPVPDFIANFTSLTYLNLQECGLHGEFPKSIFNLPGITTVNLFRNPLLTGCLPDFSSNSSSVQTIRIGETGFYGQLPNSLGNLKSLRELTARNCNLSGPIPQSLVKLTQLVTLDLANNSLSGPMPQSLLNFTQLTRVDLSDNTLSGPVPSALFSLPSLKSLDMSHNHFNGELGRSKNASSSLLLTVGLNDNNLQGSVPSSLFQLTKLAGLDLSSNSFSSIEFGNLSSISLVGLSLHSNNFHGPMPRMIFELTELRGLDLSFNNFSGVIDLGMFHNHENLFSLDLSHNHWTAIIDTVGKSMPTSFPQLVSLNLRSCNINQFPDVLRNQVQMNDLDLSSNEISGKIPQWIWTVTNGSLYHLNLSHNAFETIEGPLSLLTSTSVGHLDLSFNKLKGLIPIPPISSVFFSVSNNEFSGDVPSQFCSAAFLEVIDLSHNKFSGLIPKCLGGMTDVLDILKLGGNNFNGTFLQAFKEGCNLRVIDLSGNRLEGHLPESLASCKMLEVLDLGNNRINDTFPVWLKFFSQLRVLVLRSNQFHGTLGYHPTVRDFPQLQIFDVSFNNFTGVLPSDIFNDWKAMMVNNKSEELYLGKETKSGIYYEYTVTVVGKGNEMHLDRILTAFTLLDLSNNRFEGSIPVSVGDLRSLHIINMSHNCLTGAIPASMGNIRELESLDLSQNQLSGEIPLQLANLPWIAVLNLSQNLLVGRIPQGSQFNTFTNESFQGNLELCGPPLPNNCEDNMVLAPAAAGGIEEILESEYDWEFMWIGLGIGHGVGWGVVLWTLALWRKGRITFFIFTDRMLSFLFPPAVFSCLQCREGNPKRNGKPRLKI